MKTNKPWLTLAVLAAASLVAGIIALAFGSVHLNFAELFSKAHNETYTILMGIRLPRVLCALLIGGMLGVSGAMLQAVFKNHLADPFITGISSGAALGAAIAIVLGAPVVALWAVAGGVAAVFLVYGLSIKYGKLNMAYLLLAGVMLGSLFYSLIMLISTIFNKDLIKVIFLMMGDLSSASLPTIFWTFVGSVIVIAGAIYFANDLNIISTGEEEAVSVGVNVEFIKGFYFIAASILTGLAVALSGVIGFVGLVIPHFTRRFTGSDMRFLIPGSFLAGGLFLLAADTLARTIFLPGEIPVGIVTGLIGVPVFMVVLKGGKKK